MSARKIAYNTFVAAGTRIIGMALSLIIIGSITRYLGQSGFGEYATIIAFLFFFNVFADLGVYAICLRDISRPGADERMIASNAFTLKFVVSFFIFSLAPLAVLFFPYGSRIKSGVLIAAVGFWLLSNDQILIGVFQKYLRIDKMALSEVLGRAVQLGFVLFFIHQKMDFLFVVSAITIGSAVNFGFGFYFARQYVPLIFKFDFSFWRSLLKKSAPLALAAIFSMLYFKLDAIMLSVMKSPADVGIYGLAYKVLESLLFFPAMFVGLIMPFLSKYAFSDKRSFNKIGQKTLDILMIFIVPLVIGVILISSQIVVFIGGRAFIASAGVLNILIVATGVIFLGTLFSNMVIALEKQKSLVCIYAFGAVFNLVANLIFIPRYSYYGAALTTLFTELLATGLMMAVILRTNRTLPEFRNVFKCLLAGLVMGLSLYYFNDWNIFILASLAVLVYFPVLWLLGGLSTKEIMFLIKKDYPNR